MNQSEILKLYNKFILEENNLKQKQIKNNNSLIDNYIKAAGLITQQDEDQQTQDDTQETEQTEDIEDIEDTEQQETDTQSEENTEQSQNKEQNNTTDQKTQLRFSADLASEFGNTVNQFTKTAAEVIKQRSINKETSDKIYDLMSKIKNLLDAAGKSI